MRPAHPHGPSTIAAARRSFRCVFKQMQPGKKTHIIARIFSLPYEMSIYLPYTKAGNMFFSCVGKISERRRYACEQPPEGWFLASLVKERKEAPFCVPPLRNRQTVHIRNVTRKCSTFRSAVAQSIVQRSENRIFPAVPKPTLSYLCCNGGAAGGGHRGGRYLHEAPPLCRLLWLLPCADTRK